MLVLLIILTLSVIFGFLLLGIKLSETIKEADNKLLFWILYVVTLLSFLQLTVSIIFFIKYRKKVGPIGPRGFMGERGDRGNKGNCGDEEEGKACRKKSLMLLIEKNFRDSLGRELNKTELADIYNFVYSGALQNVSNGEINLNSTTYEDLNKFNSILMSEIEIRLEENRTNLESQINIITEVLTNMEKYIIEEESKIPTISRE
tara:strand:+ start:1691 stop:2302 length:612 start_codon:yes stop_codon:yes gene_type:complete